MVAGRDTGRVELPAGGSGAASAFPARCRAFSIALRRIGRKRTVLRSPAAGIAFENLQLLVRLLRLSVDDRELIVVPRRYWPAIGPGFILGRADQRQQQSLSARVVPGALERLHLFHIGRVMTPLVEAGPVCHLAIILASPRPKDAFSLDLEDHFP